MQVLYPIACVLAVLLGASGCTPQGLALGGATVAGTAASQERGFVGTFSDFGLRLAINDAWFKFSVELFQQADLLLSDGRAVIVGRVPDEIAKWQAGELARQVGAVQVINRLEVGPPTTLAEDVTDRVVKTRLDVALTLDEDVNALNYEVESIAGVVYLMGHASSPLEARRVEFLAGVTPSVKRVETYILVPTAPYDTMPVVREPLGP